MRADAESEEAARASGVSRVTRFLQSRHWWPRTIKPAHGYNGAIAAEAPELSTIRAARWRANLKDA
jgi:hypothetical protein